MRNKPYIKGEHIIFSTKLHYIIFVGPIIATLIGLLLWTGRIAGGLLVVLMSTFWLIRTVIDYAEASSGVPHYATTPGRREQIINKITK